MEIGYTLKKCIKYSNSIIFLFLLTLFLLLQGYAHFSTSLLSILAPSQEKDLLTHFQKTKGAKTLLLAVKGLDEKALKKTHFLEKQLLTIENLMPNIPAQNENLQKHLQTYALYTNDFNQSKLATLNVTTALETLYNEMTESFFPVQINTADPFSLIVHQKPFSLPLKNGHLTLDTYGYLSLFSLSSKTLEEHTQLYKEIYAKIGRDTSIKVFSPIFYYVENAQAIRSDVNTIMLLSLGLLLSLYLFILRNTFLLFNTMLTLASSALFASIVLTSCYDNVSIFVFVFGMSISTVAIDYMFHHYLHDYYSTKKTYNKEVLFGFLTTISAFVIISFTSFLLIKQISLFAVLSLLTSYLHFAFLYPKIGFKTPPVQPSFSTKHFYFFKTRPLFFFSFLIIMASSFWIHFDFDLKTLDYDNKALKETQAFFSKSLTQEQKIPFAIKAKSLDTLINHAKQIRNIDPSTHIALANLSSQKSYAKNNAMLQDMSKLRNTLRQEAATLGFKENYFKKSYFAENNQPAYTLQTLKSYGIDIFHMGEYYFTFAQTDLSHYKDIKKLYFVESLSLKERFEDRMHQSINSLITLGILALCVILLLLYIITRASMIYAVIFLLFPTAMITLYGLFFPFNILHIFMLFIILSIGIDYAIYLSKHNDLRTKQAISYSLISTFAGFGVLIFSQINALHSLGIIASIGIVSIFILLLTLQRNDNAN